VRRLIIFEIDRRILPPTRGLRRIGRAICQRTKLVADAAAARGTQRRHPSRGHPRQLRCCVLARTTSRRSTPSAKTRTSLKPCGWRRVPSAASLRPATDAAIATSLNLPARALLLGLGVVHGGDLGNKRHQSRSPAGGGNGRAAGAAARRFSSPMEGGDCVRPVSFRGLVTQPVMPLRIARGISCIRRRISSRIQVICSRPKDHGKCQRLNWRSRSP